MQTCCKVHTLHRQQWQLNWRNWQSVLTCWFTWMLVPTEDPPNSLHKACDKCGDQTSDTIKASLRYGARQWTTPLRPHCTSATNWSLSACCAVCDAEAIIVLEATARKAKPDLTTGDHGPYQTNELWYAHHLAESSWSRGMASYRGHSNAPDGVGYEEREIEREVASMDWLC